MKKTKGTDWEARFADARRSEVKVLEKAFAGIPAGSRMLIVTPPIVDEVVRLIPPGQVAEQGAIREALARQYQADTACPVTTGLSLRVVAERAYQRSLQGEAEVTPFWRAIDPDGSLAGSSPAGPSSSDRCDSRNAPNPALPRTRGADNLSSLWRPSASAGPESRFARRRGSHMPNHMKFCGCRMCRSGMHHRPMMEEVVRRAVRRLRHLTKLALRRGEEPPKAIGVDRTD